MSTTNINLQSSMLNPYIMVDGMLFKATIHYKDSAGTTQVKPIHEISPTDQLSPVVLGKLLETTLSTHKFEAGKSLKDYHMIKLSKEGIQLENEAPVKFEAADVQWQDDETQTTSTTLKVSELWDKYEQIFIEAVPEPVSTVPFSRANNTSTTIQLAELHLTPTLQNLINDFTIRDAFADPSAPGAATKTQAQWETQITAIRDQIKADFAADNPNEKIEILREIIKKQIEDCLDEQNPADQTALQPQITLALAALDAKLKP